ncbi:restriction endonuclease subunit S [Desulfobacula phenolica]|uniref:Type I restriction enzyme, S subunit n=1 Tax=Desulfobacula phenolica TaxID=90732 RepID=A0A1H2IB43_9BACT|nr:restriction endonuclease subunit S [Desulfobacula phenolica]SDU41337.1 type I restriction enzyme, S subunit [Desulfobacula phenolica]
MASEWKEVQLQNIVSKLGDGLHGTPKYSEDGNYYFINGNNLDDGNIVLKKDTKRVSFSEYEKHKKTLNNRTLLVSINGTIGNVAYYNNEPVILGKSACYFNLNENVSRCFVRYVLSSSAFRQYLESYSTGTTIKNVSLKMMRKFSFTLPPLPEQKAIAHILGSLDDKIELNRRMNATLEGMAQALFKSWFVDFDPVIDNALSAGNPIPEELSEHADVRRKALADGTANREAAKQFPAAFQLTEEMGWIPEGWAAMTLNQAIQINPSVKLSKGTVAPFADMKALPTDGYSIKGVIKKAYSGGAKFHNDDVLLARITPCLENGKTGIVDFLPSPSSVGFGSTEFIVLRGKGDLSLPYVACLSREENFRLHCIQSMVGSSGRQRVQNACFDSFYVACTTDLVVLKKFSEITQPMFQKVTEQSKESHTLTRLRDTLLPKLISGELRIPEAKKLTEEVLA